MPNKLYCKQLVKYVPRNTKLNKKVGYQIA